MKLMHTCHTRRWFGVLLSMLVLLPAALRAQDYLYTDAGRVKHAQQFTLNPISPLTRGNDWNTHVRGHKYFYPQDEWNSGMLSGYWWAGVLEEVLKPDNTSPSTNQFYQLFSRGGLSGDNVEIRDVIFRKRAPIRLVSQDAIPIQNLTVTVVDPTWPTEQGVVVSGPWQDGQTWTHTHWGIENPDLDRSIVHHWKQFYDGRTTISAGANKDSTVYLPEGQVLTFWLGHHYLAQTSRANSFWGNTNTWGNNRHDDYGDFMQAPSRLTSPSLVPRAAGLWIQYVKDSRTSRILDLDGADYDDTGDPLIGSVHARGQATTETGEFVSDRIIGTAYFHYDMNGDDPTDRFSLTDMSQTAPASYFATRTKGTVWGSGDWGGSTGRYAFYSTYGFHKSALRKHFESMGASTDGIEWIGITESMVATMPEIAPALYNKGGEWEHIVAGPYTLAPGDVHDKVFTFAIGDLPNRESVAYGQRYLKYMAQQKPGVHPNGEALGDDVVPMTDFEKFMVLETVKDTLFRVVDQSFWAWSGQGGALGLSVDEKLAGEGLRNYPDGPPSPDIWVVDGPNRNEVYAWYPDDVYFEDPDTGGDDFDGWRIYRKSGRADVNHPDEINSFGYLEFILVADISASGAVDRNGNPLPGGTPLGSDHYNAEKTFNDGTTRRVVQFFDGNVSKGTDYYYAVTGYDDGSQNITGLMPGASIEGSRFQSTSGIFGGGIAVTPFDPGVSSTASAGVSGKTQVAGLGATIFALSEEASFTIDIGEGPANVLISTSATADNTTIYDLVDDIQAAVDGALGANMVRVLPERPVGKPAAVTAETSAILGFETVAQGLGKRLKIADLNDAALTQLGLVAAEKRNEPVVVPNPWSLDIGASLFSGVDQNKILFDNLPRLCKLTVYTETGDLITTIDHTNQSSQELWFQQTDSGQIVKSGIYILAVTESRDVDPSNNEVIGSIPDTFVKFVIIR